MRGRAGRLTSRPARAAAVIAAFSLVLIAVALVRNPPGPPARILSGSSYGFASPQGITIAGGHVWITSFRALPGGGPARDGSPADNGLVTELDARTGTRIRTLAGGRYGFRQPAAIASGYGRIWVASAPQTPTGYDVSASSVTELSARTGAWIATLSGGRYGFANPDAIAAAGGDIWVANETFDARASVTELSARTGAFIRAVGHVGRPAGLAVADGGLWILNGAQSGSVTEVSIRTGRVIRVLSGGGYGFVFPAGITADAGHIWVANGGFAGSGAGATELSASTGRLIRRVSGPGDDLSPTGIAAAGPSLWVINSGRNGVTELSASTGRQLRRVSDIDLNIVRYLLSPDYGFDGPGAAAVSGTRLWVLGSSTVTVMSTG